jgi:gamma-glutamylcyclotransferase (GGCT)/AIG2-like uncharacterized protein YtfP
MLEGEQEHDVIAGSTLLGPAHTKELYHLVERGAAAGLVEGGQTSVVGELYEVEYAVIAACDVHRDHPRLYHRKEVQLEDGSQAFAFFWHPSQARGLRRVKNGDWRGRFGSRREGDLRDAGPFVRWSRRRFSSK